MLELYKKIFSEYNKKFPKQKDNELFSTYYQDNIEEICEIMEEVNGKITEYTSFFEEIKDENNEQYNNLNRKINNILSVSTKPDITFFENLKNTKIPKQIHKIEEKLFDLTIEMENAKERFIINFKNNNNIKDKKKLLDIKLDFIEKNFKPIVISYEKYAKETKEKYEKDPHFYIIKKIFSNYDASEIVFTTNLMNTLDSLYNTYNNIKKNLTDSEKENYEKRLNDITAIFPTNYDNELELSLDEISDSLSDELSL